MHQLTSLVVYMVLAVQAALFFPQVSFQPLRSSPSHAHLLARKLHSVERIGSRCHEALLRTIGYQRVRAAVRRKGCDLQCSQVRHAAMQPPVCACALQANVEMHPDLTQDAVHSKREPY